MKCIFHLGWINTFLSWPGFVPLSRISYIIYLMHFATINVLEGPVYYQKDASNTVMVCAKFIYNDKIRQIGKLKSTFFIQTMYFLTVLFFTSIVSAIIYVCIEMPWLNTEKLIFTIILGKNERKPKPNARNTIYEKQDPIPTIEANQK